MITHFEALVAFLGALVGLLVTLILAVWRLRGWVDRLNTTDSQLAQAIDGLTQVQKAMHEDNQRRFDWIERQLDGRGIFHRPW